MILTLGDSFTYGDELPDRMRQAWPALLGVHLDQPVTNLGWPGTCNDSIVRKLLTHTSQHKYDLVVIGWTTPNRFEVWNDRISGPDTVMPDSKLPWATDYYRYSYNTQYAWERWINQVVLVQEYLISRKQPYLFIMVAGDLEYQDHSQHNTVCQLVRPDCFVGWPDTGMIELTRGCPRGPGGHPLEQGHVKIADEIAKYIRN